MKNLFLLIISIVVLTTACRAQRPITKIASEQVKLADVIYRIEKPSIKLTKVINSNNKFTKVKQVAPKLPSDIMMPGYMKVDEKLLTQICANVIPLNTLKSLPKGYNDFLYINIKINTKGEPLETEFILNNTSLITAYEIQQIELGIKKTFKVTFKQGIERYFDGVNYFNVYAPIQYSEMLKAKEGK